MKKTTIATAGLGALGIFIVGSLGWDVAQMAAAASPPRAVSTVVQGGTQHIYLTIATPAMLGTDGPAYLPSNFTLPAHSDVTITITNFDDATALPAASRQYAIAEGISGQLSIQSMDPANPNAVTVTRTADRLDPEKGVSHTFTITKLGVSVPVAPKSKTTFTFHTGAAGSYDFRCMDPCGTGPIGWGGAMSSKGYMMGQLTLA